MSQQPTATSRIVYADGDEGIYSMLPAETLAEMERRGITLDVYSGTPPSEDVWLERIGDAEGLILGWSIPDGVLRRAPNLRAVSWVGTGVSTFVNVPLATSLGICVCNTPGYGDNAVAEHALGLMLSLARNTAEMHALMRSGGWAREDVSGFELRGRLVGVVGLGGIGTRVGQLCAALGMHVVAWTRSPTDARLAAACATYADLADLVATADIITLHLAPTPETTGLFSRVLLDTLRPEACLVNTARGELVDELALAEMLREGRIAGAALDVYSSEPLAADHPLRTAPNLILTPHIGYRTPEATRRSIQIAVENLLGLREGSFGNVVNAEGLAAGG